jgi:3-oxoacyl-[acyl-carrier protein] reductase
MGLLEGKVALVTGAGRGIGSAIAKLFGAEGAKVGVHFRRSETRAREIAEGIGGIALQADLTIPVEAAQLVNDVLAKWGRIDILVNNAASFTQGTLFVDDAWDSYQREIDGVFGAMFHTTRAAAPHMIAARYGRIINFGATLLQRPMERCGPHIAAKSAVVGLTHALARELGPYGITVNLIHPGMTLTDFSQSLPDSQRETVAKRTPLRRLAEPDDVAGVALFLASDLAGFVTGSGIAPDGGLAVM